MATPKQTNLNFHLIAAVVIAGCGLALYLPTVDYPFVFDDGYNVKDNPHIRITDLSFRHVYDASARSPLTTRPVAYISFALNYYFSDDNVRWYRITNIVIHIGTGLLVYLFLLQTLTLVDDGSGRRSKRQRPASAHNPITRKTKSQHLSFVAALLWLVHPLQTQSVIYIVQRMNSLAVFFYMGSLCLYVAGRRLPHSRQRWLLWLAAALSWLFAMGTKEMAVTLPAVVLLYEWFFFQGLSRAWLLGSLRFVVPAIAVMGVFVWVYMGGNRVANLLDAYSHREFTLSERLLSEGRVVARYLSLLFYPHPGRLNLDYDFLISKSLFQPMTTLIAFAFHALLLAMSILFARKHRLLSFCILWYYVHLGVESTVIPLELIFEHRTYLPAVGVALACVVVGSRILPASTALRRGVALAVVILLAVATWSRSHTWQDEISLWGDCARKAPNKARPHFNLGLALAKENRLADAIKEFEIAIGLDPEHADAHNNLGYSLNRLGRPDEAFPHFQEAIRLNPDYPEARNNLGTALAQRGKVDEAIPHFLEAIRLMPGFADAHANLGSAYGVKNDFARAITHCREALRIDPENVTALHSLAAALRLSGTSSETTNH